MTRCRAWPVRRCTPFNGTLNGAPFKSEPSGRTRVWQPLQSETPSARPLDVGTHRKPRTLPSFWACPPRRANSSADRAMAMICGSVLRKVGDVHLFEDTSPAVDPLGFGPRARSNERLGLPGAQHLPVARGFPSREVHRVGSYPLRFGCGVVLTFGKVRGPDVESGNRRRPRPPVHDRSRTVAPGGRVRSIGRPRRPVRSSVISARTRNRMDPW